MRKLWARRIALLSGALVLLLSAAFAAVLNPESVDTAAAPLTASAGAGSAQKSSGRKVFEAQGCMQCHSIAGEGSPRSPLDGVGSRLPLNEIRQFVIADPEVEDDLSPRVVKAKRVYAGLPADDLQALVDYLATLSD
jgi:mono/diheme cytochrome c family protein